MTLVVPSFTLEKANPNPSYITDAEWWLWLQIKKLEPKVSEFGGIYANKRGFHNTGAANLANWPTNYSIRDSVNRSGPGWTKASALDWTFDDAQHGNFSTINKYTQRLFKSALDQNDPRLDLILFEFYGNSDADREVEGYDELHEKRVSSDPSHLWHLHFSFLRSKCGDFWSMWALLTVLMGAPVAEWKASLPATAPKPPTTKPTPKPTAGLPRHELGSRVLRYRDERGRPLSTPMRGTDVLYVQTFCGGEAHFGKLDGIVGAKFEAGVKRYQRIVGLKEDGIVGPKTWAKMGIR